MTAADDSSKEESVWNHDETIRRNTIGLNRDAQIWGWFDTDDRRQWPRTDQKGLALEDLKIRFESNVYVVGANGILVNWSPIWDEEFQSFRLLSKFRSALELDTNGITQTAVPKDTWGNDFRFPIQSGTAKLKAFPRGEIPGVQVGVE